MNPQAAVKLLRPARWLKSLMLYFPPFLAIFLPTRLKIYLEVLTCVHLTSREGNHVSKRTAHEFH